VRSRGITILEKSAVSECGALDCSRLLVGTVEGTQVLYLPGYSASAEGVLGARAVASMAAGLLSPGSGVADAQPSPRETTVRVDSIEPDLPASPTAWCIVTLIGVAVAVVSYTVLQATAGSAAKGGVAFTVVAGWLAFCLAGQPLNRWQRWPGNAARSVRLLMFSGVAGREAALGIFSGFWVALFALMGGGLALLIFALATMFPWDGSYLQLLIAFPMAALGAVSLVTAHSGVPIVGAVRLALDARVVTVDASGVWLGWGRRRTRVTRSEARGSSVVLHTSAQPNWFRIPSVGKDPGAAARARELALGLSNRLGAPEQPPGQSASPEEA